jgi:hypothetical protein
VRVISAASCTSYHFCYYRKENERYVAIKKRRQQARKNRREEEKKKKILLSIFQFNCRHVLTYFGGAKYERLTTSIITGLACAAEF